MQTSIQIQSGLHLKPVPELTAKKAPFTDNFLKALFQITNHGVISIIREHTPEKPFSYPGWFKSPALFH